MGRNERQAESFRKMMLAMVQDLRVVFVKLADRLHNMRTLESMAPDKKRRIARETLEIYAPIAQRLGINALKTELEDLSFNHMYPLRAKVFQKAVNVAWGDAKSQIKTIESKISEALKQEGIAASVVGRQKNLYSIYEKMRRRKLGKLENLGDLMGFRVIVDNINECYIVLGIVHHLFKPITKEFDDYIANSKSNGYQSLHTTCMVASQKRVKLGKANHVLNRLEIQIRTRDMHHIAEKGMAVHWAYKLSPQGGMALSKDSSKAGFFGKVGSQPQNQAKEWLKTLLDGESESQAVDFVEQAKVDLVPDEIYIFTPKGDIRRLPKGATPVDFAYSIHSNLGMTTVSVRINGTVEPLHCELQSGQTVEIITAKSARPQPRWLSFVKTVKARAEIRSYLSQQKEDEAVRLGRRLLETALRDLKINPDKALSGDKLAGVLKLYKLEDIEDLLSSIGLGQRLPALVARSFIEADTPIPDNLSGLALEGTEGMVLSYAGCCRPIAGDAVVAVLSKERGVVVHRDHCRHIGKASDRIPMTWAAQVNGEFITELVVRAHNRRGLLASLTTAIAENGSSIENIQMPEGLAPEEVFENRFLITVKNRKQVADIMRAMHRIPAVVQVHRQESQQHIRRRTKPAKKEA
jgi:GTP pyrophosphokinase